MKGTGYHKLGSCELCQDEEAEVYAEGQWLCFDCEDEMAEDTPIFTGLEYAEIKWGYAKIIQGGQT